MSSKAIYPEYYTVAEYEKELDKTLKLGCVEHALLFYHFYQYCAFRNEDFISFEKFCELCDFIADHLHELPAGIQEYVVLEDIMLYRCCLTPLKDNENFERGKHIITGIEGLINNLDERLDIDYKLEVIEELDSVN